VRGLATYARDHSSLRESKTFEKRSASATDSEVTVLVVDAWSFLYALSADSRLPTIYGGEYDELANLVVKICRAWLALGLAPTFVFDGPVLADKIDESVRRWQENIIDTSVFFYRTSPAGRSTAGFQNRISIIPSLIFSACLDALLSLKHEGVECFFADGEADPECAGLAAHYNGYVLAQDSDYLIFNAAHKGYITLDDLVWAIPGLPDGAAEEGEDDGFQTVSHSKKRGLVDAASISRGLIPPDDFVSLTVTIFHPEALADHLKIGMGLLPLVASCLGCDFTPPTFPFNFFPKTMTIAERVRRVSSVIYNILHPSRSSAAKRRSAARTRLLRAAEGSDKVTELLIAVITDLSIREDLSEREVKDMANTLRDSIFHYIVPDDFPGPGPLDDPDLVAADPPTEEQRKVQKKFLKAYRKGEFNQKLMGYYSTGTGWPRPTLEDPDVKTSQEVVGGPIREWTYAVLASGLDGLVADPSISMSPTLSTLAASVTGASAEDLSFDPLVALRIQLERLRGQQEVGVLPTNGVTTQDSLIMVDSTASLDSAPEPVRPSGPRSVKEYLRKGTKLVPVKAPVQELSRIISAAVPPIQFEVPVHIQSSSTRVSLFLWSLFSNTPLIRGLSPSWTFLAACLRWTVIASSTGHPSKLKGAYRGKWTRSEVKAFIASCLPRPSTLDPSALDTRAIQLTSLLLSAIESALEYSQALLLREDVLATRGAARAISGKRFHWLV
ncbi:PIN domain-like protein, partial [Clavulina sp. PMI_390]